MSTGGEGLRGWEGADCLGGEEGGWLWSKTPNAYIYCPLSIDHPLYFHLLFMYN